MAEDTKFTPLERELIEVLASIKQEADQANDFLGEDTDIEAVLNTISSFAGRALSKARGETQ